MAFAFTPFYIARWSLLSVITDDENFLPNLSVSPCLSGFPRKPRSQGFRPEKIAESPPPSNWGVTIIEGDASLRPGWGQGSLSYPSLCFLTLYGFSIWTAEAWPFQSPMSDELNNSSPCKPLPDTATIAIVHTPALQNLKENQEYIPRKRVLPVAPH